MNKHTRCALALALLAVVAACGDSTPTVQPEPPSMDGGIVGGGGGKSDTTSVPAAPAVAPSGVGSAGSN